MVAAAAGQPQPQVDVIDATMEGQPGTIAAIEPVVHVEFPEQVFFDFDSDSLRADASPVCQFLAESLLRDVPGIQLTIIGHTDAIGTDAYNMDLSQRRAFAVMQALIARGVSPSALSAVAVGKRQPVAADTTEAGRAANRRVEFLVSPDLAANLSLIAHRTVDLAALAGASPPNTTVSVLRPAATASATGEPAAITLAQVGSIDLNEPTAAPAATSPVEPAALTAPLIPPATPALPPSEPAALATPAPVAAPMPEVPAAVPRQLQPAYQPRLPTASVTY